MTYDERLAGRVREHVRDEPGVTERRMFGGLAFLVGGHLAVSASGRGGLLLRVDPDRTDDLLAEPVTSPFVMRGREMAGWLHVDLDGEAPEPQLARWVGTGIAYARTLPPKA